MKSSKMVGDFPAILNFNWLFLKLNRFICNYLSVLSNHRQVVQIQIWFVATFLMIFGVHINMLFITNFAKIFVLVKWSYRSSQLKYRSTIAGSFKNNSKNKKRKNYEIMKTKKRK